MSEVPAGFNRHDATNLGIIRTLQALTAVVYRDSPERGKLEEQLRIYLEGNSTGLTGDNLNFYRSPIEGALLVIEEIKAAQAKG